MNKHKICKKPKYRNLVLSGGSVYAFAHIGALFRLQEKKLIDIKNLKAVAGASAGALFGFLIVLGFSLTEIWDFLKSIDINKLIKPSFFSLMTEYGMDSGKIIHDILEDILFNVTNIKKITMKQLYNITKIHFTIVGSCLTTKEIVYFDHINTPNFEVALAVRISISMPGFFTPVTFDNKQYIDGAFLNAYPMNLFEDKLNETIGILICSSFDTTFKCPEEYVMAIINLFMYHFYKVSEKYPENTIYINKNETKSIFDFNISQELKNRLFNTGISAVDTFILRYNL